MNKRHFYGPGIHGSVFPFSKLPRLSPGDGRKELRRDFLAEQISSNREKFSERGL